MPTHDLKYRKYFCYTTPTATRRVGMNRQPKTPDYEVRDCGYETECWIWLKSLHGDHGTPVVYVQSKKRMPAARWYYEKYIGPIPQKRKLYKRCLMQLCVRPEHLEPVTNSEMTRRYAQLPSANRLPEITGDYSDFPPGTKCTYAIEALGTNRIKIGRSTSLRQRMSILQCACPVNMHVLMVVFGVEAEVDLHRRFAHLRIHGEWFEGDSTLRGCLSRYADRNYQFDTVSSFNSHGPTKLTPTVLEWLDNLLAANPYQYADQILEQLLEEKQIHIAKTRLSIALNSMGWYGTRGYWEKRSP